MASSIAGGCSSAVGHVWLTNEALLPFQPVCPTENDDDVDKENKDDEEQIDGNNEGTKLIELKANHNPYTHFPSSPDCPICRNATIQKPQNRKSAFKADEVPRSFEPKAFAVLVTADYAIMG